MRKLYLFTFILLGMTLTAQAQVLINELQTDVDQVELYNAGGTSVDVSTYYLCSFPLYTQLQNATLVSGNLNLGPGEYLVVSGHSLGDLDDELGLYLNDSFGSSASIIDYLEWGSSGHARSSVAMAAGIWGMNDFVDSPAAGQSIMYDGSGNSSSSWFFGDPTFGAANEVIGCTATAGTLTTSDENNNFMICSGDGIPDPIEVNIDVTIGDESQWVITDTEGLILALPEASPFDLEGAGDGVCQIWNISYNNGLMGLAVDNNINDLVGCFDISNAVTVDRTGIEGGEVSTTDNQNMVMVTTGDGIDDIISFQAEGEIGNNYVYIITDEEGTILAMPEFDSFNFEDGEDGICRVYGMAYYGSLDLEGIDNVDDITASSCYELSSNFIMVVKNVVGVYENQVKDLSIYPNPVQDQLFMDIPSGQSGQVNIYSSTGRLVKRVSLGYNKKSVDVSDISKGAYLLSFIDVNGSIYRATLIK